MRGSSPILLRKSLTYTRGFCFTAVLMPHTFRADLGYSYFRSVGAVSRPRQYRAPFALCLGFICLLFQQATTLFDVGQHFSVLKKSYTRTLDKGQNGRDTAGCRGQIGARRISGIRGEAARSSVPLTQCRRCPNRFGHHRDSPKHFDDASRPEMCCNIGPRSVKQKGTRYAYYTCRPNDLLVWRSTPRIAEACGRSLREAARLATASVRDVDCL